jgi:hypothetical protein
MAWRLFAGKLHVNSACCAHRSLSSVNICWHPRLVKTLGTAREIAIEVVKFGATEE